MYFAFKLSVNAVLFVSKYLNSATFSIQSAVRPSSKQGNSCLNEKSDERSCIVLKTYCEM
jgi:hypothetical protein